MANYIMQGLKTVEGYETKRISKYPLHTASYDKTITSYDVQETGYSGSVINIDLDDRFPVIEWCIWNEKGDCVYISTFPSGSWGLKSHYKIIL